MVISFSYYLKWLIYPCFFLCDLDLQKDKNSIMQMAEKRIQELETYKRILERRNGEIEEKLAGSGIVNVESTKIRIEVANPTSGVDPMVDVLKCLKSLGAKTRSIQSQISDQQLVAVMDIETEVIPSSPLLSNNGLFLQARFDAAYHAWYPCACYYQFRQLWLTSW